MAEIDFEPFARLFRAWRWGECLAKLTRLVEETPEEDLPPRALSMLAHMHYYGLGTNVDEAVAMKLVWKAANDPHRPCPYACVRVGFALWHCKIIPPELQHLDANARKAEAARWATRGLSALSEQLERNEPEALNLAGLCYEYGVGAAKNPARAVSAYRAAAELGYCVAQRNLGNCLDEGEGVERDHKEAIAWYERAAAQDYPIAICSLAFSYERGLGAPQNIGRAFELYLRAAHMGDPGAMHNVGFLYQHGHGVELNYSEAFKWFTKAAELNEAAAQTNLGFMCERGLAQQPNAEEAFRWYKAAAKQNEVTAHWNLSVCYRAGTGCKQNLLMSIEHLRAATRLGNDRAKMKLGSYANLSTVESDEERLASAIARASLVPEAEEATAFAEVAKLPLALHLCSAAGAEELVSCLLEAGAPRDQCDASGRTPLHWACDGCHTGIVRLLLRP